MGRQAEGRTRSADRCRWPATVVLAGLLLFAAAGPGAAQTEDWQRDLEQAVRARGLDPREVVFPARLTEEIRSWLAERVTRRSGEMATLESLLAALIDQRGLQLEYRPGYTGTAAEVFASRTANCLAFTQLFVAASRELGIPAYFVNFDIGERYRREGDLVVSSGHVTAGYGDGPRRRILEFGAIEGMDLRRAKPISDLDALARFYANRAAELVQAGDATQALEWSQTATRLHPSLPDAWINLGVALRRTGDLEGAERAYRKAVEVDPESLPAYHNLSTVLRMRGERDAARELLRLLDRRRNRNPFIYLDLGDASLAAGEHEEAARFFKRAHRLAPEAAETRAARGQAALARGDLARARKWLERALRADSDDERTSRLEERLGAAEVDQLESRGEPSRDPHSSGSGKGSR